MCKEAKKVRIGVIGVGRGATMMEYCKKAENAELVAICDKWEEGLERQKRKNKDLDIAYYTDYDEFLKHDMDAVVLANYATEHAPFAVKALKAGKHVFSEVLPCQTLKQAVELIETVEETGLVYAYGENYCYMNGPYEMKRLYREGKIGEFEYGEGEYIHNCESIWPYVSYGEKDHWRNNDYIHFYCTHSLGPIIHITGLRPVSVVGFESHKTDIMLRCGRKCGLFGIEMVTLENGGMVKSIHGNLYEDSVWYTIYGSHGRMETAREDAEQGDNKRIYVHADDFSGQYDGRKPYTYIAQRDFDDQCQSFDHGGSDFYCMYNFVEKILGNPKADIINVYEAMDMFLPGMFAYRSVLQGGIPVEIPNLRDKEVREKYRNDTACTDPKVAGDMLLPCISTGNPDIDDSIFDKMREKWLKRVEEEKAQGAEEGTTEKSEVE